MAVGKYKVLEVFIFEGQMTQLGQEIAMRDREAEPYIKKKLVTESGFCDPADKNDQALIAAADARSEERHDEIVETEEERAEKKEEREEGNDEKHVELVEKAKALVEDDGKNHAEFERMTDAELTKTVAELEGKAPAEEKEEAADGPTVDDTEDKG